MKLRLIDCPPFAQALEPGDCWYAREDDGVFYWWADSPRTVTPAGHPYPEIAPEHAGKRPMIVVLPTGLAFCLHSPTYRDGKAGPSGWRVEGELPEVTVHPSINYGAEGTEFHWHGFIKAGRFT